MVATTVYIMWVSFYTFILCYFFFISVVKYYDQDNLQKEKFIWGLWFRKVRVYNDRDCLTTDSRHNSWSWNLRAEGSYLKPQASRESRLHIAHDFETSNLTTSGIHPPARLAQLIYYIGASNRFFLTTSCPGPSFLYDFSSSEVRILMCPVILSCCTWVFKICSRIRPYHKIPSLSPFISLKPLMHLFHIPNNIYHWLIFTSLLPSLGSTPLYI